VTASLFCPPKAIPFQIDHIARAHLMEQAMLVWDTGVGKSMAALGVSSLAVEDGEADYVIIVCEPNKLTEWKDDFASFTRFEDVVIYHGASRKKHLERIPLVLITTYETMKSDAIVFETSLKLRPGPFLQAYSGKRLLVIYDEISKLSNRSSRNYKAHRRFVVEIAKASGTGVRTLGLTATPVGSNSYEGFFNEMRVLAPHRMPSVDEFNKNCVLYRNAYHNPVYNPEGIEWLRQACDPLTLRKRKTDPDVRDQFPPFAEKFIRCQMHADQYAIYRKLEDLAWDEDGYVNVPGLAVLLRQLAGDPLAVIEAGRRGGSGLAVMVAQELEDELRACSSAKAEMLAYHLGMIEQQGHKALVFTFYGQTVLPVLARRLTQKVFTCHGQLTRLQQDRAVKAFREYPGPAVLLASDTAARGINVPEADYIIEYEAAFTNATRTQRAGRGHRILQGNPLTFMTFVTDKTIEQTRTIPKLLERNDQQDNMLGDVDADGFVTGQDRRVMFAMAKNRKMGN
jgi:superfamily II DNA or RNA helicase